MYTTQYIWRNLKKFEERMLRGVDVTDSQARYASKREYDATTLRRSTYRGNEIFYLV